MKHLAAAVALTAALGMGSQAASAAVKQATATPYKVSAATGMVASAAVMDCARGLIGSEYAGKGKILEARPANSDGSMFELVMGDVETGEPKSYTVMVPADQLCAMAGVESPVATVEAGGGGSMAQTPVEQPVEAAPVPMAAPQSYPPGTGGIARRLPRAPRQP